MEWIADPQIWISLLTLTALEIVLGIDNVIFIAILASKLPPEQQEKARKLGLTLALVTRILLLLSLTWIMGLTKPLFTVPIVDQAVSGRDLVLLLGGLFLIWKSVKEVHEKL
ncbi:MAG TPA: TerC family protein, partial [Opitutaceae bacterium]